MSALADVAAVNSAIGQVVGVGTVSGLDTLAEIAQLPAVARAELSDWLALAEARADAVAAIDMLAKSLSEN